MAKRIPEPIRNLIFRVYALVIMAVVVWAGYAAVTYLYRAVFTPGRPPEELLAWEGATRAEALRAPEALGITTPAIRSPIAHYHAVDRWFHPDLRNGCITSGCHDPIPHSKSKELRAFANLHSTFMSCEVCHTQHEAAPMPAVWTDLRSGAPQPPPAILQLAGQLTAATQPANLTDQSASIVSLLRQSLDVIGWDPVLDYLAIQLETSEPQSPVWRQAIDQLRSELPNHARGEYAAKITPADANGQPIRRDFSALVERYFSRKSDQADRGVITKQIHEGVVEKPEGCLPCHRAEPPMPPMLDFQALGYSRQRREQLTSTPVVGMMEQIHQGQPFNLPLGP
jgi:hypothetical protein